VPDREFRATFSSFLLDAVGLVIINKKSFEHSDCTLVHLAVHNQKRHRWLALNDKEVDLAKFAIFPVFLIFFQICSDSIRNDLRINCPIRIHWQKSACFDGRETINGADGTQN
jgi:hypothetical protein